MMTSINGYLVERHHKNILKMLLPEEDQDTTLRSQGTSFYNASDFPLLTFTMDYLGVAGHHTKPWKIEPLKNWWETAVEDKISRNKSIVIASTPPLVDREYIATLDGGIIHEALHSVFTVRGFELDWERLSDLFNECWDAEVNYQKKKKLFKSVWNLYEDAMIERKGVERWPTILPKLERLHQFIWEMEAANRKKASWGLISYLCCYLRDVIEHYEHLAPLEDYPEVAKQIVKALFQEQIEASETTQDSYDTLRLTFQTMSIFARISELAKAMSVENIKEDDSEDVEEASETDTMDPQDALEDKAKKLREVFKDAGSEFRRPVPYCDFDTTYKVEPSTDPHLSGHLEDAKRRNQGLRTQMALYFRGTTKTRNQRYLRTGRNIMGKALYRVGFEKDPKIFQKKIREPGINTAVQMMIDESNSMNNLRVLREEATLYFATLFKDLQIPWRCLGFRYNLDLFDDKVISLLQEAVREHGREYLDQFTRICPVVYPLYHDWGDGSTLREMSRLLSVKNVGGTPLLDAIWKGAQDLQGRPEQRKLLVVITDGEPTGQPPGKLLQRTTANLLEDLYHDTDIDVLVVNLGDFDSSYLPQHSAIQVQSTHELTSEISTWVLQKAQQH